MIAVVLNGAAAATEVHAAPTSDSRVCLSPCSVHIAFDTWRLFCSPLPLRLLFCISPPSQSAWLTTTVAATRSSNNAESPFANFATYHATWRDKETCTSAFVSTSLLSLCGARKKKNVTDVGVAKRRALLSNWYLSNLDTSAYTMICD